MTDQLQPMKGADRAVLGCLFAVVVFIAGFLMLGVVGIAVMAAVGGADGPMKNAGVAVFSFAIMASLTAFFVIVAKRLLASLRGKPVPHLFPPIVGVIAGGLMGLGAIVTGVAYLFFGAHTGRGAGGGIPIGVMFLGYAGRCVQAMRKKPDPNAR